MKVFFLALALVFGSGVVSPVVHADDAAGLRKTCAEAMNADPTFAAAIVKAADAQAQQKRDALTIATHQQDADDVAHNDLHVILAYAAMWLIAAGFVIALWLRHGKLKSEIALLRADLQRATDGGKDAA